MFDLRLLRDSGPDRRTLRQFGWLCLLVFGGLAFSRWGVEGSEWSSWLFACLGCAGGLTGTVRPQLLRPVFVGWMLLAWPIGWLVSHLILVLAYYAVVTPIGLVLRFVGKDSLGFKQGNAETYWQPRKATADLRRYFRQY